MSETDEIIERSLGKYRRCNSYLDRGCVTSNWSSGKTEIRFETYFLRPAYLRCEWQHYKGEKSVGPKGWFLE